MRIDRPLSDVLRFETPRESTLILARVLVSTQTVFFRSLLEEEVVVR